MIQRNNRPHGPDVVMPEQFQRPAKRPVPTVTVGIQRYQATGLADKSAVTKQDYDWVLTHFRGFIEFTGGDPAVLTLDQVLTKDLVDEFLDYLRTNPAVGSTRPRRGLPGPDGIADFAPATRNQRVAVLMGLSRWAASHYDMYNRLAGYKLAKTYQDQPRALTQEEVRAGFEAAIRRRHGVRDQALWTMAVFTGLRIGELAPLMVGNVDFDKELLWVPREKTRSANGPSEGIQRDKTRIPNRRYDVMPIHPFLAGTLRAYLAHQYPDLGTDPDHLVLTGTVHGVPVRELPLFPAGRNAQLAAMSAKQVGTILTGIIDEATDRHETGHALRHTFIAGCVEANMPMEYIRQLVGHATYESLKPYTRFHVKQIAAVYNKQLPMVMRGLINPEGGGIE